MLVKDTDRARLYRAVRADCVRLIGEDAVRGLLAKYRTRCCPCRYASDEMVPMAMVATAYLAIDTLVLWADAHGQHVRFVTEDDADADEAGQFWHAIVTSTEADGPGARTTTLAAVGGHDMEFLGGFGPNRPDEIEESGSLAIEALHYIASGHAGYAHCACCNDVIVSSDTRWPDVCPDCETASCDPFARWYRGCLCCEHEHA